MGMVCRLAWGCLLSDPQLSMCPGGTDRVQSAGPPYPLRHAGVTWVGTKSPGWQLKGGSAEASIYGPLPIKQGRHHLSPGSYMHTCSLVDCSSPKQSDSEVNTPLDKVV